MSPPEATLNPSLPHDLLVTCLARVSRLYYPTMSLVSKSFRSLLASPELYEARSLIRLTESCLYVWLCFPCETYLRGFTLCRKPDRTLNKSSGYLLVPITSSPTSECPVHAAVGSSIYHIDGDMETLAVYSVSVLDCRSHTWCEAPSLYPEKTMYPSSATIFDGKIYVAGDPIKDGSESGLNSLRSMGVFDTKTQIWDHVCSPRWDDWYEYLGWRTKSTCIEGKVYLMTAGKILAYDPDGGRWDFVEGEMNGNGLWFPNCVIENVLYSYNVGTLEWYDTKVRLWKQVKGLRGLHESVSGRGVVRLADYGGKMAVLWDKYEPVTGDKMIWCAVIVLERHKSEEIWGKVEWCDAVLTVPKSTNLDKALCATV